MGPAAGKSAFGPVNSFHLKTVISGQFRCVSLVCGQESLCTSAPFMSDGSLTFVSDLALAIYRQVCHFATLGMFQKMKSWWAQSAHAASLISFEICRLQSCKFGSNYSLFRLERHTSSASSRTRVIQLWAVSLTFIGEWLKWRRRSMTFLAGRLFFFSDWEAAGISLSGLRMLIEQHISRPSDFNRAPSATGNTRPFSRRRPIEMLINAQRLTYPIVGQCQFAVARPLPETNKCSAPLQTFHTSSARLTRRHLPLPFAHFFFQIWIWRQICLKVKRTLQF